MKPVNHEQKVAEHVYLALVKVINIFILWASSKITATQVKILIRNGDLIRLFPQAENKFQLNSTLQTKNV